MAGGDISTTKDIDRVYRHSECLYTEQEVHQEVVRVADRMNRELAECNPLILVVMTGALVFAGQLLTMLRFPLVVDYCQVSRYRSGHLSGNVEWRVEPSQSLSGRTIVVVDDIHDEGVTLQEITHLCMAKGAAEVRTCVLVAKTHQRKLDNNFRPDYVALDISDQFLVGSGMDYNGHGRNMAGIFSLDFMK